MVLAMVVGMAVSTDGCSTFGTGRCSGLLLTVSVGVLNSREVFACVSFTTGDAGAVGRTVSGEDGWVAVISFVCEGVSGLFVPVACAVEAGC